ncbi:Stk1 family PASTA domain-containing Ser/Thr kinase [Thalassobacillus sp. CUG 92003]|uniref:Stk1 family PASTA domain-containing Ser/Thr kinase n=1 Tax=Thalassobacillus sp. CUG 92003 TaxID=2736641 RepID=UPI0015E6982D|nr:Stk1 family PASTA domain-containing Ser/Thr kinase [Thalassobacillus sp. CUG 92003]
MLHHRLLNDRYLIDNMIGGGGMANVYHARDKILDRDVAIKVLRLEYGDDEEFIARFHREAHSATSLSHANIVNIYDVGEEDDIYYMVMEYVDGLTLKQYIQQNSPISVEEALDIMRQITSAISHAHDNGIVHRDIKPQNILIDHYGHAKVTDFGIAMALSATALTQTNSVLGSVHYLSPEQARGGMATKKSDIYSLGIVLFELLTGRLPFSGESPVSIALKHLQHDTPSLKRWNPDTPQSVENIVLKATAKDPFHRYESVSEMEEAIEVAFDPDHINEPVFTIPDDEDEQTKAIPVITEESFSNNQEGDTIVHTNGQQTKTHPEKETPPPKKKKKKRWIWAVSIVTVLLLAAIAAIFMIPGIIQPKDVEMINVDGMEYEEAYSELNNLNLNVERETMYSENIEEGYVIKSDPEAGRIIEEGSTVTLYSSRGKEKVAFGSYVGDDYESVKAELEEKGYGNIIPIEETSDQPDGQIIEQIQPQSEEEVVPEEARVIFKVSVGPPTVMLKQLEGETREDAESYLNENDLNVEFEEAHSEDVSEGHIISQEPEAFSQVEVGSTVTLTESIGPKEEPPRTETVSVTVPYQPDNSDDEDSSGNNGNGANNGNNGNNGNNNENNNQNNDSKEQKVLIYIDDMNNDISEVFREETITEETEFEFDLTIAPDRQATYKVVRDDEVIKEETVSY